MQKINLDVSIKGISNKQQLGKKAIGLSSLFYISLWGLTNATVICKAYPLTNRSLISIVPLALPINWAIYPFKPLSGKEGTNLDVEEKTYRIACFIISSLIGMTLTVSLNHLSVDSDIIERALFGIQLGALAINLIACKALKNQTSNQSIVNFKKFYCTAQKLIKVAFISFYKLITNTPLYKVITNTPLDPLDPNLDENMIQKTRFLKIKNEKIFNKLRNIKNFIANDKELTVYFLQCYKETKSFLFPRAEFPEFESFDDPIIEALSWEKQIALFLKYSQENLWDFFENNPNFSSLLYEKIKIYKHTKGEFYKDDELLFLTFNNKSSKIEFLDF